MDLTTLREQISKEKNYLTREVLSSLENHNKGEFTVKIFLDIYLLEISGYLSVESDVTQATPDGLNPEWIEEKKVIENLCVDVIYTEDCQRNVEIIIF